MALNDNSKDRIRIACKELEDALALFEQSTAKETPAADAAMNGAAGAERSDHEKIHEITRQLRSIRAQLDSLSR